VHSCGCISYVPRRRSLSALDTRIESLSESGNDILMFLSQTLHSYSHPVLDAPQLSIHHKHDSGATSRGVLKSTPQLGH
jgi:hypothetical protein